MTDAPTTQTEAPTPRPAAADAARRPPVDEHTARLDELYRAAASHWWDHTEPTTPPAPAEPPSLIKIQDALIARLQHITTNGVGDHRPRSRARAMTKAQRQLEAIGFTPEQARAAVMDARDMAELGRLAADYDTEAPPER